MLSKSTTYMEDEKYDFDKEFEELRNKYNLPSFEILAQDFDVEKATEKETLFILRETRRAIVEKLSGYMHLLENLINPNAPPMFVYSILKSIKEEDRENMKDIYKKLSKMQIGVMKLDAVYSEKSEADFINESFKQWQDIKKNIYSLVKGFEDNWEKGTESKNRNYLG